MTCVMVAQEVFLEHVSMIEEQWPNNILQNVQNDGLEQLFHSC